VSGGGPRGRVVVIGCGNEHRGDDGAGLAVARALPAVAGVEVRAHAGEGLDLLTIWEGAGSAVVIDAMRSGAVAPGTLVRFDAAAAPLPAALARAAGHAVGLAEAVELARALARLPARLVVFGVEGERFGLGEGLGPAVARSIPVAVASVLAEVRRLAAEAPVAVTHG
jgi:hydrogenase maturation protease